MPGYATIFSVICGLFCKAGQKADFVCAIEALLSPMSPREFARSKVIFFNFFVGGSYM